MYACLVACLLPAPADLARADTVLRQPAGTACPPCVRLRHAVLAVLLRDGAVDPGGEGVWFQARHDFDAELDYARGVLAAVRLAPPAWAGDWLPDAETCGRVAAALEAQARGLEERAPWEDDRRAALEAAACEARGLAYTWHLLADCARPGGWARPRRVRLADARVVLGPRWDSREWPESAVWRALVPR